MRTNAPKRNETLRNERTRHETENVCTAKQKQEASGGVKQWFGRLMPGMFRNAESGFSDSDDAETIAPNDDRRAPGSPDDMC